MVNLVLGLTFFSSFYAEFSHSPCMVASVYGRDVTVSYRKKIKENNVPICASFGSVAHILSPADSQRSIRPPQGAKVLARLGFRCRRQSDGDWK